MKNIFVSCIVAVLVLAVVMPVPSRAQTTQDIDEVFNRIEDDLSTLYCMYYGGTLDGCSANDDSMAKRGRMGISQLDNIGRGRQSFKGLKNKILGGAGKH